MSVNNGECTSAAADYDWLKTQVCYGYHCRHFTDVSLYKICTFTTPKPLNCLSADWSRTISPNQHTKKSSILTAVSSDSEPHSAPRSSVSSDESVPSNGIGQFLWNCSCVKIAHFYAFYCMSYNVCFYMTLEFDLTLQAHQRMIVWSCLGKRAMTWFTMRSTVNFDHDSDLRSVSAGWR